MQLEDIIGNLISEKKEEPKTVGDSVKFVPSAPAIIEPVAKPEPVRKQVDEGKVALAPKYIPDFLKSVTVYSKGYALLQWPTAFYKVGLYRSQLVELIKWARSSAADDLIAELDKTGQFKG